MAHHHEEKSSLHNKNNNKIMVSSSTSSTFCYPEISPTNNNPNTQFHNNNNNFDHQNPEIYHLANGLEMIGFQPKQLNNNNNNNNNNNPHDHHHASKSSNFMQQQHHHNLHQIGNNFLDETTLRTSSCVFPCEGIERPSQGLSLSLSSSNPSSIGVQSFELRNNNHLLNHHHHHHNNNPRFNHSQSSFQQQEFFLGKSASNNNNDNNNNSTTTTTTTTTTSGLSMSLSSKYMGPTQELLNEFCNLGTQQKQSMKNNKKKKNKDYHHHDNNWELLSHDHHDITNDNDLENNASSSSSSRNNNLITTSLYGLSILDLQKRKTKLFGMLEELDRRYKHYCDQMKGIESSFESAAGVGTANVYTILASKAMSKHFRCLRDSLVAQIKATKKAMGEKDASSNSTIPGTSKGETPRLRILDQTLRQQRVFQQMSMMEAHPWRPQRGLPERSVSVLRAWLFEHFLHPYPSDVDKHILARQTGLSRSQVSNWFINARVRLWKPMVEQMYQEESKEQQDKNMGSSSDATDHQPTSDHDGLIQDQKPNPEELVRLDHHESLSSIVNTTNPTTNSIINNNALNTNNNLQQSQPFGRAEPFGYVALADFPSSSSYNDNNAPQQGFGGSTSRGNNVSLTLGLQQHGGNGVSLAFSPASQGTLFYGRDHIDDCQPSVHDYSLLDGDQGQNLPYRNLMDAQLLHDFAQ